MSKIVLSVGSRSVVLPMKWILGIELAAITAVLVASSLLGWYFKHPIIGGLIGFGLVVAGEVAEYLIAKKATQSGKLRISIQY